MRQSEMDQPHLPSHLSLSQPRKHNWARSKPSADWDKHPGGEAFTWHPPPPPVLTGRWCISPLCLHLPPRLRLAYRAAFSVCEKYLETEFWWAAISSYYYRWLKTKTINSDTSYSIKNTAVTLVIWITFVFKNKTKKKQVIFPTKR